jgi:uncharacterized protein (TIGR00661 family)
MRILFGIQCTGNGHLGRSEYLIKSLRDYMEVDVLLSGRECELKLETSAKYQFSGIGFQFGNKGGIHLLKTALNLRPVQFIRDLRRVNMDQYDAVISDFEPMSLILARRAGIPSIGLSNQYAYKHIHKPRSFDIPGKLVIKYYARAEFEWSYFYEKTGPHSYHAFIPEDIAKGTVSDLGHVVVYLPAYHHEYLGRLLSLFPYQQWMVFGKRINRPFTQGNVHYMPICRNTFSKSLLASSGIICAAGFGTTAEALHLGKKLLIVPMKAQLEQKYNAHYLASKGVEVMPSFELDQARALGHWLQTGRSIQIIQADERERITSDILDLLSSRSGQLNTPLTLVNET